MYQIRQVVYSDVVVSPGDLVTVTEAARLSGLSKPGVIRAIERGMLTEIVELNDARRRRYLLRVEVERYERRKR